MLIVVLTLTNTRGLRLGALIQNSFTFAKTAALIGLIVDRPDARRQRQGRGLDVFVVEPGRQRLDLDGRLRRTGFPVEGGPALVFLLGLAMIGPLFSQSAWNNVTFTGGETRDPGRTLPRALFLGTASVVALYLLANLAYVVSLPLAEIQHAPQDRVGTAAMEAALGPPARYAMAAAILISTFGCVNGLVLAGARVYYAMARDGLFFKSVGTTNAHHVPAAALAAQGLWSALLALPVTVSTDPATQAVKYGNLYSDLLEYIIPVDVTFYTLMVGAVIALRIKAPFLNRPVPDRRLPDPGPDLHRPGGLPRARLHLPQAQDLGNRFPDRAGGHPGLPDLATDRRHADGRLPKPSAEPST